MISKSSSKWVSKTQPAAAGFGAHLASMRAVARAAATYGARRELACTGAESSDGSTQPSLLNASDEPEKGPFTQHPSLRHIATFCGQCSCGCPELYIDDAAAPERRIVITDDFGQRIQMSVEQLADLVSDVRRGVLDEVVAAVG